MIAQHTLPSVVVDIVNVVDMVVMAAYIAFVMLVAHKSLGVIGRKDFAAVKVDRIGEEDLEGVVVRIIVVEHT